jgi:hypothetical protein
MTIELMKKGSRSVVLWQTGERRQFVTCTDFDPTKPEGSQWIWGHYFQSLVSAVDDIMDKAHYFEVVEVDPSGDEEVVDTAYLCEEAIREAELQKKEFPNHTYKVVAYRECETVCEL